MNAASSECEVPRRADVAINSRTMKPTFTASAMIGLLWLWGCGPHLGSYRFEQAELVNSAMLNRIDPTNRFDTDGRPALIRILFSSEDDLTATSSGGGLYVHADYCPFNNPDAVGVVGPFYEDQSRYGPVHIERGRNADGSEVNVIEGEDRHPPLDPRTHRYLYTAYIIPVGPSYGTHVTNGQADVLGYYDLHGLTRDLCLRIDHPGYYLSPSQSEIFVVPRASIAAALASLPTDRGDSTIR